MLINVEQLDAVEGLRSSEPTTLKCCLNSLSWVHWSLVGSRQPRSVVALWLAPWHVLYGFCPRSGVRAGFPLLGQSRGETMMTRLQEYQYLSDLVMQAALWRVDKDEGRTPLELEVLDRMNKLSKELNSDCDKKAQVAIEQREKDLSYKQKWSENKCRVDGKWYLKSECIKVPRKDGIGWKWALKSEVTDVPSEERN